MSDYQIEQHFVVIKKEKDSLQKLLDRKPYISIQQISSIQELDDEMMMDVWIRFGFEDDLIPRIPKELRFDELERIVEGYLDSTRAEDMTWESYLSSVNNIFNADYENVIRSYFLEQGRFAEKVREEMASAINEAFYLITGSKPKRNQLPKLVSYWWRNRFKDYASKEYRVAQHRLEANSVEIARVYFEIGKDLNKTCYELTLFEVMDRYPEKFEEFIIKATISNPKATEKWMKSELDNIKVLIEEE